MTKIKINNTPKVDMPSTLRVADRVLTKTRGMEKEISGAKKTQGITNPKKYTLAPGPGPNGKMSSSGGGGLSGIPLPPPGIG